ncbi:MAG: hypothetical protein IJ317_01470, partial [Clostridia bacterium]|nr:hypothetical protein [Clostridia bacterium]
AESESVKEELLKKLRDKTGITYHSLERDLQRAAKDTAADETPIEPLQNKIAEAASGAAQTVKAVRFILAAKLFNAAYAKTFDVSGLAFSDNSHRVIAQYIAEREKAGERIRPSELFEMLDEDDSELSAIFDLNYEDKLSGEIAARFFSDSVRSIERAEKEKTLARLNEEYANETDEEKRKEIAKKIANCVAKRR